MSQTGRTITNVLKTLVFLVVLWAVFLFGLPIAISIAEINLGIQRFPPLPVAAALLLLAGAVLAAWSALMLAVAGDGTPLSLDPPRRLVTTGPYGFIRHPFATAITMQIVGLGLALGSVPVLVYAAASFAFWYFVIRPGEERTLASRFGDAVAQYRARVRGFRPRLKGSSSRRVR
jgi:protein-S-isoprenylcysteine O-methyltransferase Ste14